MDLKKDEHFYRDDYDVKILNIRQTIDADTGAEYWQVDAMICVDNMDYMRHGFKTEIQPNRSHLKAYMDVLIPEILAHESK